MYLAKAGSMMYVLATAGIITKIVAFGKCAVELLSFICFAPGGVGCHYGLVVPQPKEGSYGMDRP